MSKDDIIAIILKHLEDNLDDIDISTVSPETSMRDYGANSLDMIEVVSATMRELKIRVPRSDLAEIETIDQLAAKFLEHVE
ncbi:acyl carrier protein [Lujinxingia litoralis]|uniref:Acyl carrier protein n=1 Tax=Lujinxingia litoralis TaxID=2211119 RepID=A0A328C7B0_9DELT|nr:phosphopantetheine-binding protein [Lujinxingia litoralis]RAL22448.1 acyl carrier protein [Lujinxingia litoralis]